MKERGVGARTRRASFSTHGPLSSLSPLKVRDDDAHSRANSFCFLYSKSMTPKELLASTSLADFIAARPPSTVVTVSSSDKLDHVSSVLIFEKSNDLDGLF